MHDTSTILKKLIQDGKQNQVACSSLAETNVNTDPVSSKILVGLLLSSDLLHKETKAVASKVATVIEENKTTMSLVADEMAATTTQIEKDVRLAVKSLQFQDMTTQLIVQCGDRLSVMQEMLNAINLFSQKSAPGDSAYVLQTKLSMARDELKQAGDKRMKQFNVDAGSVELFD
jgi:ATP-dependent Lon protease